MVYATELVLRYRQALTTLWNTHFFWTRSACGNADGLDSFKKVILPLFVAIVSDRIAPELEAPSEIFGSGYRVMPKMGRNTSFPKLLISANPGGSPTGPCRPFSAGISQTALRMTILDFFDWEGFGSSISASDLRYFLVRIDAFDGHPEEVGNYALLDVLEVDVFWESPGVGGLPMRTP
jgi:hypothetical protein